MSQHNVYTTYPKINTSAYSSVINDINKKRYPARLHTAFWGPPMCTEERKTTQRGGGGGRAAIRDKESCGKDFNQGQHRHNSIDLNNVQHREQDRDKYKVLVCKLEQTTGPTDDLKLKKRLFFRFVI
ncbi:hypothetical protein E3U43_007012 [Larimichthys crocea]|uniref:Uncharacterized protein n=1 Tax=Larimichthys crocea TaxID=215358 RepID=A0ACD3RM23_LARCR|nr:hypothetical protein E3U43_007012 [Larimichthys crocea]